jgi:hypothetical protein
VIVTALDEAKASEAAEAIGGRPLRLGLDDGPSGGFFRDGKPVTF